MAQSTLDDDELFSEAASEMREDVESSLEQARDALPEKDAIWDVDSENTLGVLNTLNSALDTADATDHLRDAKKWYAVGERPMPSRMPMTSKPNSRNSRTCVPISNPHTRRSAT
jgi:hypothetical protein